MMNNLTSSDVTEVLHELNVETTLPITTLTEVVNEVLNGISTQNVVNLRRQANTHRSTFGSLADIQYVAEYALAIKTIYEVVVYFNGRPEIKDVIEKLKDKVPDIPELFDDSNIDKVVSRFVKWFDNSG